MKGSSLVARVHRTIAELPPDRLARLSAGGSLYDTAAWLTYCERSAGGTMRHISVEDGGGRIVGLASARMVAGQDVLAMYDLSALLGEPDAPLFPSTVAAVSGAHCVLLVEPALPPAEGHRVLRQLVEGVLEVASAEGARSVGFLYLPDEHTARTVADLIGPEAAEPFLLAADTSLAGGWSDFEEYLATLPSHRRNTIRRERKQFAQAGLTGRVTSGVAGLGEETAELQLALRRRYGAGGTLESILRDYANLAVVGDRVRVFRCEKDGRTVGMSLALQDGDKLTVRLAGFDYAATGQDFAYFNAVYYEPIQWGIEHGIREYSFGTGTYRAKLARGARPVPRYATVRWPAQLRATAEARLREREQQLRGELGLAAGDNAAPPRRSPAGVR